MFEIKNVSKRYNGEFTLNSVSLNINKGLNFIVGASGSGKTTLLKIISGMEKDFDGEVSYCGKSVKELNSKEISSFYNNVFGFVWQDFNLIDELTVLENVLIPQRLKKNKDQNSAERTLKSLKIFDLANKKVKYLSGGQKQRVAIARELMKNPQVIIADEPTSALDDKTSKETMSILRNISKNRAVIIVTHDTSLISHRDNVFQLDKGELVEKSEIEPIKMPELEIYNNKLSVKNAFLLAKSNIKRKLGRFSVSCISIMVAAILLLTTFSGAIKNSGQEEFDKLIETYGEGLLDINIVSSFMGASGTDGKDKDEPNTDVKQDISGLYDKYVNDERVEYALLINAFDEININIEGKNYKIDKSGSYPSVNKLVEGKMPNGTTNEVIVPESFVKLLGIDNKAVLGKEMEFNTGIFNWDTGSPVLKQAKTKAVIVGVVDTTVVIEYEGKFNKYTIDDTFIFSKSALEDLRKQANLDISKTNFTIRAKSPADMISLKDEFNKNGIVPTGRFELVEDIVRLNTQTTKQSGSASVIIAILSLVMVVAIFLITSFLRKREYAIYKVSGFNNAHLCLLGFAEIATSAIGAILLMVVTSPLTNLGTKGLFGVDILNPQMILIGVIMAILTAVLAYFATTATFFKTDINKALKTGDR